MYAPRAKDPAALLDDIFEHPANNYVSIWLSLATRLLSILIFTKVLYHFYVRRLAEAFLIGTDPRLEKVARLLGPLVDGRFPEDSPDFDGLFENAGRRSFPLKG